ncbi:hypothetical protein C8F04DRAFT_1172952 [Mycena alexandri]|uniref:Uncharacterized protein n=1 Tax=Mycena alexandri TaxID=1745969 RepID=A0AAD6TJ06_9AGAR|nr:hypothetical protein C8F04DRAFT_1172952 [Mycena alexandri]
MYFASIHNHIEIGVRARKVLNELVAENLPLETAVASLNTTAWRKGKVNILNILELPEDIFSAIFEVCSKVPTKKNFDQGHGQNPDKNLDGRSTKSPDKKFLRPIFRM